MKSTLLKNRFATAGVVVFAITIVALQASHARLQTPLLKVEKKITIPGGPGGFDWMLVDRNTERLYATHKGTKSCAIVDLRTDMALTSPVIGTAQGVAVAKAAGKIYLGDADEKKIAVLDNKTMKKVGEIAVEGPVDDVIFCEKNGMIYADHDDGEHVWVINPKTDKIVGTVRIPEAPEKMEYDPATERIYQNIKSNNTVQVIDPMTNKVVRIFKTEQAVGPHGIALDSKAGRIYVAGKNGKLVVIDIKSGNVIQAVSIAQGTDQIAIDHAKKRIYCACKNNISVVEITDSGAKLLGNVPTPDSAHTIAVDSQTHAVWTCYFDASGSYLLKLLP
ncbi:MAG: YncE family protein [Chthonomonadales bacterium]